MPRSCSTRRNTALMYSCMFWSSCNLILYSFFQIHFATEIRSFVYLLKLFPHVLRTCAVADVNKLVVFNSQRYRTLSVFVFSLPVVRDWIRCDALHYRPCVLTNQQHP